MNVVVTVRLLIPQPVLLFNNLFPVQFEFAGDALAEQLVAPELVHVRFGDDLGVTTAALG